MKLYASFVVICCVVMFGDVFIHISGFALEYENPSSSFTAVKPLSFSDVRKGKPAKR